jgi:hypothetical protein
MLRFMLALVLTVVVAQTQELSPPPLIQGPPVTTAPAPPSQPPATTGAPRRARLLTDEAVFEPASSSELAGRAVMAPLLAPDAAVTVARF